MKIIEELLKQLQFEHDKTTVLQKLDEQNYAPIHYAVMGNNKCVLEILLGKFKCGKVSYDKF